MCSLILISFLAFVCFDLFIRQAGVLDQDKVGAEAYRAQSIRGHDRLPIALPQAVTMTVSYE